MFKTYEVFPTISGIVISTVQLILLYITPSATSFTTATRSSTRIIPSSANPSPTFAWSIPSLPDSNAISISDRKVGRPKVRALWLERSRSSGAVKAAKIRPNRAWGRRAFFEQFKNYFGCFIRFKICMFLYTSSSFYFP